VNPGKLRTMLIQLRQKVNHAKAEAKAGAAAASATKSKSSLSN